MKLFIINIIIIIISIIIIIIIIIIKFNYINYIINFTIYLKANICFFTSKLFVINQKIASKSIINY